jgi:hypothetical protein
MSKTRSKSSTKKNAEKVVRKPTLRPLGLEIGDGVRITDIPSHLKDPKYDLVDAERREMRTAELFRFCLGRVFTIYGFGRHGHVELEVSKSPPVRKKFGLSTIWIEPEFVKRVRKSKRRSKAVSS